MEFTVVSHACLYVEHLNTRLLIDPWVIGSCYWRSWWNYPKVDIKTFEKLNPTHIYITHLHWDHYHGTSLRYFQKFKPKILFPKHFNRRMKKDCIKDFKFLEIHELDHGKSYNIGKEFSITSYQFNPVIIDSSILIEAENIKLLNCNDSKVFGLSLKQIINKHKKIDFVFRSHSSATPIPQCIRGQEPQDLKRTPLDYAEDFIAFAKATQAKYAIPFASSHLYLHKLTMKFNKFYSNPKFVKNHFDSKLKNYQQCVLMQSGSKWSKEKGFEIKKHDYSKLAFDIKKYKNEYKEKINRKMNLENKIKLNKKAFHKYFSKFLSSINFPLKINFRFAFLINEKVSNKFYLCIIDGKKKKTSIVEILSENEIYNYDLSFVIITPIYVFNDCNVIRMHNTFTPSKLLEIILISVKGNKNLNLYFSLVDFYENDCLPLYKMINFRNLIIVMRRWREFFDILIYFYQIKVKKKMIYQLYSTI